MLFSTHYLEEAHEHADRVVLVASGRVLADGTPAEIKVAAGTRRTVRFRLLRGEPEKFRLPPGVTAMQVDGNWVTLRSTDADATLWSLYGARDAIADVTVADASLQEAFFRLV